LLGKYAKSIDHIAIAVKDLEASIAFYQDVLGFELHERRRTEGQGHGDGLGRDEGGARHGRAAGGHVARVPGLQICRALRAGRAAHRLRGREPPGHGRGPQGRGLEFDTDVIASPGLRQIFSARDPGSGMMYEFIERMGGDFSDDSVKSLFEQLEKKGTF